MLCSPPGVEIVIRRNHHKAETLYGARCLGIFVARTRPAPVIPA